MRPAAISSRSVNRSDRHILAQQDEEAFDLSPFAEADRIPELAIMATARRGLIDSEHAELTQQVFRLVDAGATGDIE